jgi:hypothetical protein
MERLLLFHQLIEFYATGLQSEQRLNSLEIINWLQRLLLRLFIIL